MITNRLYPTSGATTKWDDYYEHEAQYTPCPSGYRIPNQRELMLLYTRIPDLFTTSNVDYMAKTEFSFKDYEPYRTQEYNTNGERVGFSYAGGNLYLISAKRDESGIPYVRVRCVRDVY